MASQWRFSVSADPEAAATSPIVSVVDRLAKKNMLKAWPRPPVPEYPSLEAILGEEIHRALRREVSDREALEKAQSMADLVMRAAGYY
jgi:multiple sugar transport system substrate-binding protein